jgi:hypothetical protein
VSDPKEVIGALYFADHEPCITGKIVIGTAHYDLSGIRRKNGLIELTGRRVPRKTPIPQTQIQTTQMDMFDENSSGSGERKQHSP